MHTIDLRDKPWPGSHHVQAGCRPSKVERAVDLLTDITSFSNFPDKEIEKEKQVISEEIDMYEDSPDEAILDKFDGILFPGHRLGDPILGTKESIKVFSREQLLAFRKQGQMSQWSDSCRRMFLELLLSKQTITSATIVGSRH